MIKAFIIIPAKADSKRLVGKNKSMIAQGQDKLVNILCSNSSFSSMSWSPPHIRGMLHT